MEECLKGIETLDTERTKNKPSSQAVQGAYLNFLF